MYICVYIYAYKCMYVCVYVYMYVCMYEIMCFSFEFGQLPVGCVNAD